MSASTVSLSWAAAANDYTYTIRRATTSGGPYTTIATGVNATSFTDMGLTSGTTYYYVIAGDNTAGESANSSEDAATASDLFVHLKFDDGSGAIASDASGNGWDGTLVNSPTWSTSGKVNTSLTLTGSSSQYVQLPSGVVAGQTSFTVAAWVYLTTNNMWMRVFDFGTGTSNYMFLSVKNGSGVPRFGILLNGQSTEQGINGTAAIPTGVWTHIAVTWSNNVGTLYVNGVQVGQNTNMTWNPSMLGVTTNNYLGKSQWNDPYFDGSVDDFRLYARALSAAEIQSLATTAIPAAPTGLTASVSGSTQVQLAWTAVAGATSYHVYRATSSGGPFTPMTQIAANQTATS
jgi:hypothetical protein